MTPERMKTGQLLPLVVALCASAIGVFVTPAQASNERETPCLASALQPGTNSAPQRQQQPAPPRG